MKAQIFAYPLKRYLMLSSKSASGRNLKMSSSDCRRYLILMGKMMELFQMAKKIHILALLDILLPIRIIYLVLRLHLERIALAICKNL
jgi:hypothetical protein